MEREKSLYSNLSKKEIELLESYNNQIDELISSMPQNASDEEKKECFEQQKYIYEEKIEPLQTLSFSRKAGW